jgi:glycosyltransferase involved in cell wall biosynthesis
MGIRVLYSIGGRKAPPRVDVSDLFANRLTRAGLDITWHILVPDRGAPLSRTTWHEQPAWQSARSRLPGLLGAAFTKLSELFADLLFLTLALSRPFDLIQVRDKFLAGVLGLLAARIRRLPFVFWLSYPFPEARVLDAQEGHSRHPWFSRLAGGVSGWMLYRIILPGADHVFVQSEQMKRDVERPGLDSGKLTSVPMGIPDEDMPPLQDGISNAEPLVLYLGTLARVRRLDMLIEAMDILSAKRPDARLVFVGEGDSPADRAFLEEEVSRLGLSHCISFTGQLSRQEALAWVGRAAVCLSPFYPTFVLRSTSPTKLIEYMALGKAVVANDHPEQADVLAASGAGLCVPWSADEFAGAMLELLNDPERAAEMGRQGRAWVWENRTYSRIAARLLPIYHDLVPPPDDAAQSDPK